jgi:hypothetical protein
MSSCSSVRAATSSRQRSISAQNRSSAMAAEGAIDQRFRLLPAFTEGPLPYPREVEVQMPQPPRDGRDRRRVGLRRTGVGEDLLDPLGTHTPVIGDLGDGHATGGLPGDLGVLARRDVRLAQVEHPPARSERPGRRHLAPMPDRPHRAQAEVDGSPLEAPPSSSSGISGAPRRPPDAVSA